MGAQVFLKQGLLSQEQLDALLVSEFNPVRMGFAGIAEITTRDVLNCGVAPKALLEAMRQRFLGAGGWVRGLWCDEHGSRYLDSS